MTITKKYIRFDWAIKKLLRQKANFSILEGFLSELLGFDLKIHRILESESNKEDAEDKFNRVDMLVEAWDGELMIVEVQNEPEVDYFQRMLYGVSKVVTEYIHEGEDYADIKKVYAINIAYFNLGQGEDYIYEYDGKFIGKHLKDILTPSIAQKEKFKIENLADIFPKYYLLKVNNFNDIAKDSLDEWIYFLKNSEIPIEFKAKGINEARKKMLYENMSDEDKKAYQRYMENRRIEKSELNTARMEGEEKGVEKTHKEVIENGLKKGYSIEQMADLTNLSISQVKFIAKVLGL